jgi:hypothetical protein
MIYLSLLFCLALPLTAQQPPPGCLHDIETHFFTFSLVAQALSTHKITQDRWGLIYRQLEARSAVVPTLMQQRAKQLLPNPLQPYQPEAAAALLRAILFEIFEQTMRANYINDPYAIQSMFNYIRVNQASLLRPCVGVGALVDPPITE